jgi:AAA15 family ATPase/GTPase
MLFGIEGRQNQVAQFDLAGRVLARNYYQMMPVRFYKYRSEQELGNIQPGMLIHPFGQNLISVLISNGKLKDFVAELFRSKGYRFQINNAKKEIGVYYEKGDAIVSCPYNNISETLRRIIFFMACLETNAESTLVFDEPEANTFPFYTKYFAERIAQDESNQFFMTTHNPYLLGSLVEKCPATDLSVYVTYMRDFETYVRKLSSAELIELMDTDAFFNLSRFVEQNA